MQNTNMQDEIQFTRKIKYTKNLCHELQEIMQNKIMRFTFTLINSDQALDGGFSQFPR